MRFLFSSKLPHQLFLLTNRYQYYILKNLYAFFRLDHHKNLKSGKLRELDMVCVNIEMPFTDIVFMKHASSCPYSAINRISPKHAAHFSTISSWYASSTRMILRSAGSGILESLLHRRQRPEARSHIFVAWGTGRPSDTCT